MRLTLSQLRVSPADGKRQFQDEVFPAELEEIQRRRAALGQDAAALHGPPSTAQGLVGLALSGGGIRSAAFSLGVVQALSRRGRLSEVDYLSTVSGGGFMGSALSSALNTPHVRPDGREFPFSATPGEEEPPALQHLRNGSNYLNPGGLLAELRIPALVLRGILLNLVLFLPALMMAAALTWALADQLHEKQVASRFMWAMLAVYLFLAISFPLGIKLFGRHFGWRQRNIYELIMAAALGAVLAALIMVPVAWLIVHAIGSSWGLVRKELVAEVMHPLRHWWKWGIVALFAFAFLNVGKASQRLGSWTGKLAISLLGLLGPAIVFGVYLLLLLTIARSPFLPGKHAGVLDAACGRPTADPDSQLVTDDALLETLAKRGVDTTLVAVEAVDAGAGLVSCRTVDSAVTGRAWTVASTNQLSWIEEAARGSSDGEFRIERHDKADLRMYGVGFGRSEDWVFLLFGLLIFLFNLLFVDVNTTSFHGFYRDRLSRVFLLRTNRAGDVEPNDQQKLSELNADGTAAPYHLINTALNLTGSRDADLRGRRSDFFVLSKRYVGCARTGYCETGAMEEVESRVDLGTAMAISGAAASPNMGTTTVKPLVFILTLLNVRLGYWLPNPALVRRSTALARLALRGAGPRYLLSEALGMVDAAGFYVNVSDGGHIENLGVYPLLRRRCKLIIAVDGEADPGSQFNGLVTLIRFARIDLGIEIDLDLEALRTNAEGRGRQHWTLGRIDYGNGEIGTLVYIKSSVTGDEPEYVRNYRAQSHGFPHESTANQFFTEVQFEAYRALGYHAASDALADPAPFAAQLEELISASPSRVSRQPPASVP